LAAKPCLTRGLFFNIFMNNFIPKPFLDKSDFGKDIDKTKELEYLSVQELERIFERK
jgi:hypothetical protein